MIIFLYGPDTFRSRKKLSALKQKFVSEIDQSGLNVTTLDGALLEAVEFEKAVSTQPFLAKKRMVVIENLLSKNRGQKIQKEILELLSKNNLESTIIIFWEGSNETKKLARSKTATRRAGLLFDRLKKEQYAQEFKLLTLEETRRWINAEVQARNGSITPAASTLLTDFVGNDLWRLNTEVEKLLAYCQGKTIEVADVESLVQSKLDDDIFKLTDAIGQRNRALALSLITDQLDSGTSPTELFGKIVWQFKNLLLIKGFIESRGVGYTAERIAYQLGLHPFVVKKTTLQASRHQLEELKRIYRRLLEIEHKIKTSQGDPEVLFDLLIVES